MPAQQKTHQEAQQEAQQETPLDDGTPATPTLETRRFAQMDALCFGTPDTRPRLLLAVFHGYGATAHDLLPLASSFATAIPDAVQLYWQAPQPCLVAGQAFGRAWFPLNLLSYEEIVSGLNAVEGSVADALKAASAHYAVPVERIALFGFSQGGMVALQAVCKAEHAWLAAVGVATRFVEEADIEDMCKPQTTPIMMIHGEEDKVVAYEQGLATALMLQKAGYNLTWQARKGMEHAIDETTLKNACLFLARHAQRSNMPSAEDGEGDDEGDDEGEKIS